MVFKRISGLMAHGDMDQGADPSVVSVAGAGATTSVHTDRGSASDSPRASNVSAVSFEAATSNNATPAVPDDSPSVAAPPVSVDVQAVSCAWRKDRIVLQNVSFSARPGQIVAVVGPVGCGACLTAKLLGVFGPDLVFSLKIAPIYIARQDHPAHDAIKRNHPVRGHGGAK